MPTDVGSNGSPEDVLVDFLNTIDIEDGIDEFSSVEALRAWTGEHGRGAAAGDLDGARRIREALRGMVGGDGGELPSVSLSVRANDGAVVLAPATVGEAAVAAAVTLAAQGRMARVKLCLAHDCRYAFYDLSRNGSRTWCQMGICGNRAKARTYRARKS